MAYERRGFAGGATSTTLNGGITAGATTITLNSSTGWPDGAGGRKFAIVIDPGLASEEKILIDSRSASTLTVDSRGYDGTTAQAHSNGATVQHIITAVDADEANLAVSETIGKVTTAEDLLVATGANAFKRLGKGSNGQTLTTSGGVLAWSTPSAQAGPAGYLGSNTAVANQGSIGSSPVTLNNGSVSISAGTSRRLRIHAHATFTQTGTMGNSTLSVYDVTGGGAGTLIEEQTVSNLVSGARHLISFDTFVTGVTGSKTYALKASATGSNVTVVATTTSPTRIVVEDIFQ